MKIEKRNFLHFLSFLLAALMIFSLTPLSVYAADRSVTPKYDFSSVDDINIYNLFMKTKGYTYIDLLSEYQGTPSFSSPIFTFDDGKFNMTYTTN